jgi:Ca-activated chloride channel family protein
MQTFHSLKRYVLLPVMAVLGLAAVSTNATSAGLLTPVNSQLPALDIQQHHVNVVVEDGYATTTVEQVFSNPHTQDLEAVYSFPLPQQAAVSEFTVWIDGQPVTGEVLKKQKAREVYASEKAAGRDAGLMQQDSFKTFDISVSPVRAMQHTRVRFAYMQTAQVDTGMGRYVYPLEEGGVDEQKLAFWTASEAVRENFSFKFKLRSSYPVDALRLPNHPLAMISQSGPGEWLVDLSSAALSAQQAAGQDGEPVAERAQQPPRQRSQAAFTLDKDLVVYWRHQTGLPASVDLVTYKPDAAQRGSFMLTLTPGDDLQPINEGSDWVFVLDVSGSMRAKYATLVDGVQRALGKMRSTDRFRIILFNDSVRELTSGYTTATPQNIERYAQRLLRVDPGSGTNLYEGLKKGLAGTDADRTSAIVLVTDGVANVGETSQRQFIRLIERKDIRLFTFVMGNSANRPLLDALTRASNGFAVNVSNSDDIVGRILEAVSKVTHEALHGVQLAIQGVRTADLTPTRIGSLYRGQQLIVLGHYWGDGEAEIRLSGRISGQDKVYATRIAFPASSNANPELERLWAFASITDMMAEMEDFGDAADLEQAVTDLALEYGLVTDYTSMLVLRDEARQRLGIEQRNANRLHTEQQAREFRAAQPIVTDRVDAAQPMFSGNRVSHSGGGGGAFSLWFLLVLMVIPGLRFYSGRAL